MRIPFILLDNTGGIIANSQNIEIKISIDGSAFTISSAVINTIGSGWYYADIPDSDLNCNYFVVIQITALNAQMQSKVIYSDEILNKVFSSLLNWQLDSNILTLKDNTGNTIGTYLVTTDDDGNIVKVSPRNV